VGDRHVTPPELAAFYTEKLLLLPHTFQVTSHFERKPHPWSDARTEEEALRSLDLSPEASVWDDIKVLEARLEANPLVEEVKVTLILVQKDRLVIPTKVLRDLVEIRVQQVLTVQKVTKDLKVRQVLKV
jgi:hypothetical protein